MKLLLDTHILLGVLDQKIDVFPLKTRQFLGDAHNEFHVSAASLWEIAIKQRLGKLVIAPELATLPGLIADIGISIVPITAKHALAPVLPEPETRDPFDRMLLAQCAVEGLRLVTIDRTLIDHPLAAGR